MPVLKNDTSVVTYISYQGICHKCEYGYYYPGGNSKLKPDDIQKLSCSHCGYDGVANHASTKKIQYAKNYRSKGN